MVGEDYRLLLAAVAVDNVDDVGDLLLGQKPIDQIEGHVGMTRQDLGQQHAPGRRLDALDNQLAVRAHHRTARPHPAMQRHRASVQGLLYLADVGESHALAGVALAIHGEVIKPQHDVLGRHDDRFAVRRAEDVVGRHHQHAGLQLGL